MKKILLVFVFIGLIFTLVGCANGIENAIYQLEQNGYVVEQIDENLMTEYREEVNGLTNIYEIFDEEENSLGFIFEFEDIQSLDYAVRNDDTYDYEYYENYIHENLLVITEEDTIVNIIKE